MHLVDLFKYTSNSVANAITPDDDKLNFLANLLIGWNPGLLRARTIVPASKHLMLWI